jgi:hypothetical protein
MRKPGSTYEEIKKRKPRKRQVAPSTNSVNASDEHHIDRFLTGNPDKNCLQSGDIVSLPEEDDQSELHEYNTPKHLPNGISDGSLEQGVQHSFDILPSDEIPLPESAGGNFPSNTDARSQEPEHERANSFNFDSWREVTRTFSISSTENSLSPGPYECRMTSRDPPATQEEFAIFFNIEVTEHLIFHNPVSRMIPKTYMVMLHQNMSLDEFHKVLVETYVEEPYNRLEIDDVNLQGCSVRFPRYEVVPSAWDSSGNFNAGREPKIIMDRVAIGENNIEAVLNMVKRYEGRVPVAVHVRLPDRVAYEFGALGTEISLEHYE